MGCGSSDGALEHHEENHPKAVFPIQQQQRTNINREQENENENRNEYLSRNNRRRRRSTTGGGGIIVAPGPAEPRTISSVNNTHLQST